MNQNRTFGFLCISNWNEASNSSAITSRTHVKVENFTKSFFHCVIPRLTAEQGHYTLGSKMLVFLSLELQPDWNAQCQSTDQRELGSTNDDPHSGHLRVMTAGQDCFIQLTHRAANMAKLWLNMKSREDSWSLQKTKSHHLQQFRCDCKHF